MKTLPAVLGLALLAGCLSTSPVSQPDTVERNLASPDFDRLLVNASQALGQFRIDYKPGVGSKTHDALEVKGSYDFIAFTAQYVVPSGTMFTNDVGNVLDFPWWKPQLKHEGRVEYVWDETNWNNARMTSFGGRGVPDWETSFVHLPWEAGTWELEAPDQDGTKEWSFVVTAYGVHGNIGPPPVLVRFQGEGCRVSEIQLNARADTYPQGAVPPEYIVDEDPPWFPFTTTNYECERVTGPNANATDVVLSLSGLVVLAPSQLQQNATDMDERDPHHNGPYLDAVVTNSPPVAGWLRDAGLEPRLGEAGAQLRDGGGRIEVIDGEGTLYGLDFTTTSQVPHVPGFHTSDYTLGGRSLASYRVADGVGAALRTSHKSCQGVGGEGRFEAAADTLPGRWGQAGAPAYGLVTECGTEPIEFVLWQAKYIVPPQW